MSVSKKRQPSRRKLRNYLLQPLWQIRLGLYSIILAALFSFAASAVLYGNLLDFAEIVATLSAPESETPELFAAYSSQTLGWVLLLVLSYMLSTVVVSVVYTHKLLGPAVAFRQQLQQLLKGDYSARVKLRQGDAFGELAADLNRLSAELQRQEQERQQQQQQQPKGE